MANQVKPFEVSICLGFMVWCCGDDFNEPEGTVFFDASPKIGDTAVLSDGQTWRVVRESNEQAEISMERVE